ncbi:MULTISPECIES: DUF2854 domain-containing protein [unclassified Ruminococcus]|uniref:DUF2854 domain-containing protein n=1 Tax=unclassified Ruminococcus TaxID=2608920 RepID=UPI00210E24D6|nr:MULTISPECIES: DUF2854 domain-containing protein [unclassified Ruminococcus]MCQ4021928.1 DUF2854 domain-containing protein [Ruminococcus sp. zg-924]MCQ4115664.1 DUF2854 domain-containing protein [Ruminococcus sp. zg-921]
MIDNNSKSYLRNRWNTKVIFLFLENSFRKMWFRKGLFAILIAYIAVVASVWFNRTLILGESASLPVIGNILKNMVEIIIAVVSAVLLVVLLLLIGMPRGAKGISNNLHRMGLVNYAGEAPVLISRRVKEKKARIIILEFESNGIPVSEWQDKQEKIEAALNIRIESVRAGENPRRVLLYAVDGKYSLPDILSYTPNNRKRKGFVLDMGESLVETVTVDLSKVPHVLIGGSTGSGKSVLLKLLLMQCVLKEAKVYIADFKGGVDFPTIWHRKSVIVTKEDELLQTLLEIKSELKRRKKLLVQTGVSNIDEYNKLTDDNLCRIVVGCDEIAEVLDKSGLDKTQKEKVVKIESCLSVIARQGRAFGIHLIIATQRPDATILSGQIKNNIDFRVCGRADNILSMIVLDNTDAAERIPKDSQGRFLTNNGVLFQAYTFDEHDWVEGD